MLKGVLLTHAQTVIWDTTDCLGPGSLGQDRLEETDRVGPTPPGYSELRLAGCKPTTNCHFCHLTLTGGFSGPSFLARLGRGTDGQS